MWHDPTYYRWHPLRDEEMPTDGESGYMGSDWQPCDESEAVVMW